MKSYKKWSKDEDLVLLSEVKKNPSKNLNVIFLAIAKKLDRSPMSIKSRYKLIKLEKRKGGRKAGHSVWTKENERRLIQAVKANPYNRYEAFRQVEKDTGISWKYAKYYWYNKDFEVCTMSFSPKQVFKNRTSYVEGRNRIKPTTPKQRFWNRIKTIFGWKN